MTENELISFFNHLGDEPADALLRPSGPIAARTDLVRMLRGRGRNDEEDLLTTEPFLHLTGLPAWADPGGIRAAQELFYRRGARILTAVFCAVLPRGYALGGRSAIASRSSASAARCMRDNAQFIIDVLTPEAWTPRGRGIRSIHRLRLLHALARIRPSNEFPAARSQSDLAAALAAYSVIPLRCLEKLGQPVSAMESAAYTHFWNVVGHLLGLHPRLRFKSPRAASAYLETYETRARSRDDHPMNASPEQSPRALMTFMNSLLPEGMAGLPEAFLILLLGRDRAGEMGVSPHAPHLAPPLLDPAGWLRRMSANRDQAGLIFERTGRALLDGLRKFDAQGRTPAVREFALPPILGSSWKVDSTHRLKRRLSRFSRTPKIKGLATPEI